MSRESNEKKTISGRVPADTEDSFEEFRMRRGLNKTDALRRLIEEGLDSYQESEDATTARESTIIRNPAPSWVEIGTLIISNITLMIVVLLIYMLWMGAL